MKKRSGKSRRFVLPTETAWVRNFLYSILCGCLCLLAACRPNRKADPDQYALKASDTQLAFPLDENTRSYIFSLVIYSEPGGEEYLVFKNGTISQLLFYKMKTQQLYKKITCELRGPDAVPKFGGFFIRNMNEIYLSNSHQSGLSLIDGEGKRMKLYQAKTKNGKTVETTSASTGMLIHEFDHKLYIPLSLTREYGEEVKFQKSPLCATLNLENDEFELLPATYFDAIQREGEDLIIEYFSRCTNGKQFIYSFWEGEDLYVTDLNHTSLKRIKAKSKYLPTLQFKSQEFSWASPDNYKDLEAPRYGNILYDPYRKVYYRVAFPPVEIEKGINGFDLGACGGKNFSILILNKDFEIIGETLMPDYTYNPRLWFVRKDGLYISESHLINPNFDENKLCFRRLELVREK